MNKLFFFIAVFCISAMSMAQVGIGNDSPDASSILDVTSTNKGVLLPRVNLTSSTLDIDGVAGQAVGLLVYNTGSTFEKGLYFWNGMEWRNVNDSSTTPGAINELLCSNAELTPNTYTGGTAYVGVLTVPYSGGNNGTVAAGTAINSTGVTGLIATLRAGTLNFGSGYLIYDVVGTPSSSSPDEASFAIPNTLGATGCTVTVGNPNKEFIPLTRFVRRSNTTTTTFTGSGVDDLPTHVNAIDDGNYDAATNTYTIPETGVYELSITEQVLVLAGTASNYSTSTGFVITGLNYVFIASSVGVWLGSDNYTDGPWLSGSTKLYLQAGDTVTPSYQNCNGGPVCATTEYKRQNISVTITQLSKE